MVEQEKQMDNSPEVGTDTFEELVDSPESIEELVDDISAEVGVENMDPSSASASTADVGSSADASGRDVSPESEGLDGDTFLPSYADLEQTIQSLKALVEERTTQYMRIAADFDNFRKRTQKEKEDQEVQIKCSTISELLPVVDNFERARAHLKPQTEQEMNIHKSYQGVYKQLVECLKRVGVSPMRSEGKEFDPAYHEAVMRESTDQYPEGTVIEELVRGYLLGERVLRHAMVKVAATPEGDSASESSDQGQEDS
ncbi:nucleotide exchange factor GrpE [Leptolyngbya sp. 'hensonii']|uniref:nucleotide exchange factor GrpE n=1 Tax=Leptolyngbya sp. 'hensonii' TaxID=1922337 RepID=UPI00094F6EB0|nr:nucleotide exchange factor GrpE [Leptolyngbya sp. 'hensonii']OLP16377.1 nucleotide exchange factor GrpE [Leptolyngbya sp. 'hensonii']